MDNSVVPAPKSWIIVSTRERAMLPKPQMVVEDKTPEEYRREKQAANRSTLGAVWRFVSTGYPHRSHNTVLERNYIKHNGL